MGKIEQRLAVMPITQATSKAKSKNGAKRKAQAKKAQSNQGGEGGNNGQA